VEHAPAGDGLRLGRQLLAAAAPLAAPRRLAEAVGLLAAMLQKVDDERGIDWSKVVLDSQSIRAVFGGR
jgi:hypothetical protein